MNSIKNKILKWVHNKLFPTTYQINFSTPDDMVRAMYAVDDNKLVFFWLNEPCLKESVMGKTIGELNVRRPAAVCLNFYTSDSIDRLIWQLEKVKTNLVAQEVKEIMDAGGTVEFTYDKPHMVRELMTVTQYYATFKMPPNP